MGTSRRIEDIPPEEFVALMSAYVFSDDEIADWLGAHPLHGATEVDFLQTLVRVKGAPITGRIRTALRASKGLPPVPGD